MRMNVLGMFKREDYFRIFIVLIFILSGFTILIRTAYADDTVLYADFPGSGIWKWDSTWSQVTPNNPQFMAAAD
jgi:hypothetical protein